MKRKKVVKRLSPNQEMLRYCIKDLFEIYKKVSSKSLKKIPWDYINNKIIKIICELFTTSCTSSFNKSKRRYEFKYSFTSGLEQARNEEIRILRASEKDISQFKSMIKNLTVEITAKSYEHINLVGITDTLKSVVKLLEKEIDGQQNYGGKKTDYGNTYNIKQYNAMINKEIIENINENLPSFRYKKDHYEVSGSHIRRLQVKPISMFAKENLFNPTEKSVVRIFFLTAPDIRTFRRLARYILIYFHLQFGNFKRLKICNVCHNLFFETKIDTGKFCSNSCRRKGFVPNESKDKIKCRNRQNEWITRKAAGFTLQKNHCEECNEFFKRGGSCIVLEDQNDYSGEIGHLYQMKSAIGSGGNKAS